MSAKTKKELDEWQEKMQANSHQTRLQYNARYTEVKRFTATPFSERRRLERIRKLTEELYRLRGHNVEAERDLSWIIRDWNNFEDRVYENQKHISPEDRQFLLNDTPEKFQDGLDYISNEWVRNMHHRYDVQNKIFD